MPAHVYLETFGCQMNELDSQLVTSALRTLGYQFTSDPAQASVILYNTCSVRELAEQKVWSRLGEMALRKKSDPALVVGVLGCMAEREGPALIKRMPVVDVLVGPAELDKLPGLIDNARRTNASLAADEPSALIPTQQPKRLHSAEQVALAGGTMRRQSTLAAAADELELLDLSRAISPEDHDGSAYVRITRGCNKFCTYCVVPHTRGAEVHRPPQHIVDECKKLADAGVIEVTLLGQTVNHYRFEHGAAVTIGGITQPQKGRIYKRSEDGRDAYGGENVTTFADLLHMIHEQVPAIRRLRFVTSYPKSFGDDVLSVIRQSPRICRYLHVPAQSGSDRLLQLMNRGYSIGEYLEFLDRARHFLHEPEKGRPLTLAGDIIVGFPTETEEDHLATAELLRKAQYKNCFIFKYSPRPGTVAIERFEDDVEDAIKRRRNNELLDLQTQISDQVSQTYVGQELDVFVTGLSRREEKKSRKKAASKPGTISLTISARSELPMGSSGLMTAEHHHDHQHGEDESQGACSTQGSSVYVEGGGSSTLQLSSRTDGDLIVLLDVPAGRQAESLIGTIQRVRIGSARSLSLFGAIL
jgi:tRNA-2-methylthio-N6-dimethylallyladenosine synthase